MSNKKVSTFPIFLVFLCMGFGDVVGPMVSLAKETFELTNFLATLLPFSGFLMFGILSIPMGIYQDRKGKKKVLLIGLAIAFVGLLLPIISGMYGPIIDTLSADLQSKFYIILASILLLGAGATVLQVSGNSIMRDVSAIGRFSSNLSLGQSIKAIGSSLGFLLPPFAVMAGMDWTLLFPIYAVLILITFGWTSMLKVKEVKYEDEAPASFASCISLLKNKYVLMMVVAIFVYVGAEVSMSSGVPILLKEEFGLEGFSLWLSWSLFFLPILIGRFLGAAILTKVKPIKFLFITVILAIVGVLLLLFGNQAVAYLGIVLVGLGFANIFPLVFSITVDKLPERANELSGLMVTAIVGGAFIPPLMGLVADSTSILLGFLVPLACLIYILFSTIVASKK
ncbi:MAG: MFS transporter [Bacteroidetes bacterium]|nr:MFS transporter [Bacteroidota bacterium]